MTPADLRAKAKALRAEAAKLVKEADNIEAAEAHANRVRRSRETAEAKAASQCRPVWTADPGDGVYVVAGISDGCFAVERVWPVASSPVVRRYLVRTGYRMSDMWERHDPVISRSRLDNTATILAWRAWCAARKESASPVNPSPTA